jgi:hypothetical protein
MLRNNVVGEAVGSTEIVVAARLQKLSAEGSSPRRVKRFALAPTRSIELTPHPPDEAAILSALAGVLG